MKANSHFTRFLTSKSLVKGFIMSVFAASMFSSVSAQSNAISLDGTDDCVLFSSSLVVVPMTMEVWFKADQSSTSDQYIITSAKSNKNDWYTGLYIGASNGTTPNSLCFIDIKNGVSQVLNSTSTITFGEWNHAAVVVSGTNQYLYLNGMLVDSDVFTPSTMNSHNQFGIGVANTSTPFGYFDGEISDVRVWATDLDSTTIRAWMHETLTSSHAQLANLALYLPGDDATNDASALGSTNGNASTSGTFSGASGLNSALTTTNTNVPKPYTTNGDGQWNAASTWPAGMGSPKSIYNEVIINHSITMSNDASIRSLQVGQNASLSINSNVTLEVNENILNNGTITIEDRAALVQNETGNTNTGSGSYVVKRQGKTNALSYNIWSSPVVAGDTTMLNGTAVIYFYNPTTHAWYKKLNIAPGEGVFARGNTGGTRTFTGTVNNGPVNIALEAFTGTGQNWNLVGNPYPCAIDADAFLQENAINNSRIQGTLYFWDDDNTGGSNGSYSSNDYATYTTLGGTSASGGGLGNAPSGVIGSLQGFFVEATGAGTLNFNNSMRVTGNNNQFFKGASDLKSLVWLNFESGNGGFNQILVGLDDNATLGYDQAIDAKKNQGNSNISFASLSGTDKLAIQGLPHLNGFEAHTVALEVFTTFSGTHKISIDHSQLFDEYYVELEDKVTGYRASLKNNPYKFTMTAPARTSSRFVLHIYKMKAIQDNSSQTNRTGGRDFDVLNSPSNDEVGKTTTLKAFGGPQTVFVQSSTEEAMTIELIDMSGKLLRTDRIAGNEQTRLEGIAPGMYLIKYESGNTYHVEKVVVH